MVDTKPFPRSPEWEQVCAELSDKLSEITAEDVGAFRARLFDSVQPSFDRLPEERRRVMAALSKISRDELIAVGRLNGEPNKFPDMKGDLSIVLNCMRKQGEEE